MQTQPTDRDVKLTGKPDDTAVILVSSAKDAGRLKKRWLLRDYEPGAEMVSVTQGAYILEVGIQEGGMSATDFRTAMKNDSPNDNQKMMIFREFFGTIEPQTYEFIRDKLNVKKAKKRAKLVLNPNAPQYFSSGSHKCYNNTEELCFLYNQILFMHNCGYSPYDLTHTQLYIQCP